MKMKKTAVLLFVVIILMGLSLVVCSKKDDGEQASLTGPQLLQQRCTACHNRDRVNSAEFDREGWETVVDRMIDKGAKLSAEERTTLIDHLVEQRQPIRDE